MKVLIRCPECRETFWVKGARCRPNEYYAHKDADYSDCCEHLQANPESAWPIDYDYHLTDMAVLDRLIKAGWGDWPSPHIPRRTIEAATQGLTPPAPTLMEIRALPADVKKILCSFNTRWKHAPQ